MADVEPGVADGRRVPVDDRGDAAGPVRGDHHVEGAVVAVHDARHGVGRTVLGEPSAHEVDLGKLAGPVAVELGQPARDLPLEEAVGLAESDETPRLPVDAPEVGDRVDHVEAQLTPAARAVGARERSGQHTDGCEADDPRHEQEGRTEHRRVVTEQKRLRVRDGGALERAEDAPLARHVGRARRVDDRGWSSEHPLVGAAPHEEQRVRHPGVGAHALRGQRLARAGEPVTDPGVERRRRRGRPLAIRQPIRRPPRQPYEQPRATAIGQAVVM